MRMVKQSADFIIKVCLFLFLFTGWAVAEKTVKVEANYTPSAELESVKEDMAKLDAYASEGKYEEAGVLIGKDIKARDIYRAYLNRASQMSNELLSVREKMGLQLDTLSLQELGALSQRLALHNLRFKEGFSHGEQKFQTYKLIEKAVSNLEDAIFYWRTSNRFRHIYHGGLSARRADDEVLRTKLETAMNAIDELKAIVEAREALTRDLTED